MSDAIRRLADAYADAEYELMRAEYEYSTQSIQGEEGYQRYMAVEHARTKMQDAKARYTRIIH